MGLLSAKPSPSTKHDIDRLIFEAQGSYRIMCSGCGTEVFVNCKKQLFEDMDKLPIYEKKYRSYFGKKHTPSENYEKIQR